MCEKIMKRNGEFSVRRFSCESDERVRLLEKENQELKDRIWFLSSSISVRDGDIEVLSKENRELKDEIFDFQKRKYLRIKGVPRII